MHPCRKRKRSVVTTATTTNTITNTTTFAFPPSSSSSSSSFFSSPFASVASPSLPTLMADLPMIPDNSAAHVHALPPFAVSHLSSSSSSSTSSSRHAPSTIAPRLGTFVMNLVAISANRLSVCDYAGVASVLCVLLRRYYAHHHHHHHHRIYHRHYHHTYNYHQHGDHNTYPSQIFSTSCTTPTTTAPNINNHNNMHADVDRLRTTRELVVGATHVLRHASPATTPAGGGMPMSKALLDAFLTHVAHDDRLSTLSGPSVSSECLGHAHHAAAFAREAALIEHVLELLAARKLKAAFDALYMQSQQATFKQSAMIQGFLAIVALAIASSSSSSSTSSLPGSSQQQQQEQQQQRNKRQSMMGSQQQQYSHSMLSHSHQSQQIQGHSQNQTFSTVSHAHSSIDAKLLVRIAGTALQAAADLQPDVYCYRYYSAAVEMIRGDMPAAIDILSRFVDAAASSGEGGPQGVEHAVGQKNAAAATAASSLSRNTSLHSMDQDDQDIDLDVDQDVDVDVDIDVDDDDNDDDDDDIEIDGDQQCDVTHDVCVDDPIALYGLLACLNLCSSASNNNNNNSPSLSPIFSSSQHQQQEEQEQLQQRRVDVARRLFRVDRSCKLAADVLREAHAWAWRVNPRVDDVDMADLLAAPIEHDGHFADVSAWIRLGDHLSRASPSARRQFWCDPPSSSSSSSLFPLNDDKNNNGDRHHDTTRVMRKEPHSQPQDAKKKKKMRTKAVASRHSSSAGNNNNKATADVLFPLQRSSNNNNNSSSENDYDVVNRSSGTSPDDANNGDDGSRRRCCRAGWWPGHFFRPSRIQAELAGDPQLVAVKAAIAALLAASSSGHHHQQSKHHNQVQAQLLSSKSQSLSPTSDQQLRQAAHSNSTSPYANAVLSSGVVELYSFSN